MDDAAARRLFDANAESYDRVNTVISLGLDARWREWAARQAVRSAGSSVLDAFAGTGQVGIRCAELGARVTLADASPRMLDVARRHARVACVEVRTVIADLAAPCPDVSPPFDAVTMMWGLRYVDDPVGVVRSLSRLVAPGGRMVIVEFVEPAEGSVARLAGAYFFRLLPWIAGSLAGRRELYGELVNTTHAMGPKERVVAIVDAAGLEITQQRTMGFGMVVGLVATTDST